jgi:alcohol dehydrogenase
MQNFDFNFQTHTIFGENTIDQLGELAGEFGRRALLVTDPGIAKAGHAERAVAALEMAAIEAFVFQDVVENPTTRHVEAGVRFTKDHTPIDVIIALGGGSVMDCAKGINFILTNGGKMEEYWGFGKARNPMLPSIGIPTTAGTGSEVQSYALISHAETREKMACGDKKARYRVVILDPVLLTTAPKKVAAIAGIDAISHAIESYVCTKRNPFSQMFAREAWRLLTKNYEIVLSDSENITAWGNMLLGAHFAGTAIEHSMLGAAHACANPLTARYGITHGIAVGLMLPHVIRFNGQAVNGYYGDLLLTAGGSRPLRSSAAELLADRIFDLKNIAGLSQRLRDLQVDEKTLPQLAEAAAKQWTAKFNPRPVGEKQLLQLYEQAF